MVGLCSDSNPPDPSDVIVSNQQTHEQEEQNANHPIEILTLSGLHYLPPSLRFSLVLYGMHN
jgi:hypothetical protein